MNNDFIEEMKRRYKPLTEFVKTPYVSYGENLAAIEEYLGENSLYSLSWNNQSRSPVKTLLKTKKTVKEAEQILRSYLFEAYECHVNMYDEEDKRYLLVKLMILYIFEDTDRCSYLEVFKKKTKNFFLTYGYDKNNYFGTQYRSEIGHVFKSFEQHAPYQYENFKMERIENFYCKRRVIHADMSNDGFNMDIVYSMPLTKGKNVIVAYVKSHRKEFLQDAINTAARKALRKKGNEVQPYMLCVRKSLLRINYGELIITISLREDILRLKEKLESELNPD